MKIRPTQKLDALTVKLHSAKQPHQRANTPAQSGAGMLKTGKIEPVPPDFDPAELLMQPAQRRKH